MTAFIEFGGVAPVSGAPVTLSSNDPSVFFPFGNSVTMPVGGQVVSFPISTAAVGAPTPVTLSASRGVVTVITKLTLVPEFTLTSVSVAPASLFGLYGGTSAVGAVTLSGPAADGVVISLTNPNPTAITMPSSVSVPAGATTATFLIAAFPVQADTPVVVSGSFQGLTLNTTVTIRKNLATVVITKAQYTASKSQLDIEATSTDGGTLEVVNARTGAIVGFMNFAGGGKYVGKFFVPGGITSAIMQSTAGGMATGPVAQR